MRDLSDHTIPSRLLPQKINYSKTELIADLKQSLLNAQQGKTFLPEVLNGTNELTKNRYKNP
ncbi:MAG: hypothetical protein SAJ12_23215, partial [Jaaginema sp. PMC 1079.18]|nr:hypothetical protein [Jaaginema sp. PMC 1080.18]MEC4853902.1 hypothetical protein [Jaaginema sp. PMC 1079.18]